MPRIKEKHPKLEVNCYGDMTLEFESMEITVKLTRLTLRTLLMEGVEFSSWRNVLCEAVEVQKRLREAEAGCLTRGLRGRGLCISDMGGRRLKEPLMRKGIDVRIRYCERPYHFPPLRILNRLMAHRPVEDWEIERYVKAHLDYLKGYIYRFDNRDRAYYEWVNDTVPWMKGKLERDEIKALDSIIQ
ncbi:MAG: hypothetical protein ACLFVP_01505 [Candidatus Bathyarchaeia archaeon]